MFDLNVWITCPCVPRCGYTITHALLNYVVSWVPPLLVQKFNDKWLYLSCHPSTTHVCVNSVWPTQILGNILATYTAVNRTWIFYLGFHPFLVQLFNVNWLYIICHLIHSSSTCEYFLATPVIGNYIMVTCSMSQKGKCCSIWFFAY